MQEIEVSGKNIEEAISSGLKQLNCSKEDVEIKILDEGTTGLFGLMGAKPAKVLLTLKDNNVTEKEQQEDAVKKEKNKDIDFNLACKNAKEHASKIISMMGINVNEINVTNDEETVNLEVSSDSGSLLIGRGGQTLDSLEYVVQLIINNNPNTRVKVNVDTEGYRAKQQEKLKTIILKAIEYVNRTKKIYRFDPMSARERKFIHMYFKNKKEYDTFSEGNGLNRKVGVKLAVNNK